MIYRQSLKVIPIVTHAHLKPLFLVTFLVVTEADVLKTGEEGQHRLFDLISHTIGVTHASISRSGSNSNIFRFQEEA